MKRKGQSLLKSLRQEIKILSFDIENIKAAVDRNKEYEIILANYNYEGSENETLEIEIKKIESGIKELEEVIARCNEAVLKNEERREKNSSERNALEKMLMALKEQKESFNEFLVNHEEFKKYNNELLQIKKNMETLTKRLESLKEDYSQLLDERSNLKVAIGELKNVIKVTAAQFELYKNIEGAVILKEDKNVIEGKLQACEKQLGDDIKRDKEQERRLSDKINKVQVRVNRIAAEGNLSEEYKKVVFSEQYLGELRGNINALEVELNGLQREINSLDKELSIIIEKKQREVEDIEKLNFEGPISKEKIKDSNFKSREKRIKEDLKENNEIIKDYLEQIDKLKFLKQKLGFYRSFSTNNKEFIFDFTNLEAAIKEIESYIKAYEEVKRQIDEIEGKITKEINTIHEKYRDKNRFVKERLFAYSNKDNKILGHSDIESLLEVVDRRVRTLELELSSIMSEEEVVINEIQRYANHVLGELRTIDKKSSIKHLGKTQKLLDITIPEEKDEVALEEYIKGKVLYYGSFEEDYSKELESDIQSAELLSKLIGNINRIHVTIKKIEKTGLVRKRWKEALSQNSGGEKFVSMFILLSSLMSYMRKRETDIDNKEERKILIMDNPFAKTNADHLLEPMFQIAEKYNMQLICFSGIGGSSVYNRFNKIYVAKVVEDKFRNKENVSFKAGSEETLELSDFTISKDQLSWF